jgi:hypothetical protein
MSYLYTAYFIGIFTTAAFYGWSCEIARRGTGAEYSNNKIAVGAVLWPITLPLFLLRLIFELRKS